MESVVPLGHGPWFVALLWNTNQSKKQTEIVAHTYPHLFTQFYNNKDKNAFWVILMKIGPFDEWSKCTKLCQQWSQKTRDRVARIEKGITLHQKMTDTKTTLWIQTKDRETIRKEYDEYLKSRTQVFSNDMCIFDLKRIVFK